MIFFLTVYCCLKRKLPLYWTCKQSGLININKKNILTASLMFFKKSNSSCKASAREYSRIRWLISLTKFYMKNKSRRYIRDLLLKENCTYIVGHLVSIEQTKIEPALLPFSLYGTRIFFLFSLIVNGTKK